MIVLFILTLMFFALTFVLTGLEINHELGINKQLNYLFLITGLLTLVTLVVACISLVENLLVC